MSLLERCPHFRGCYVHASMELGPEDVSLLERCPHFRGCYVQASVELGPEDVSLLERCPHFRGCYVQASMELGLKTCPELSSLHILQLHTSLTCSRFVDMAISPHVMSAPNSLHILRNGRFPTFRENIWLAATDRQNTQLTATDRQNTQLTATDRQNTHS